MTAQTLDRRLSSFRIGGPAGTYRSWMRPVRQSPGRWNTRGCPIIYTSEHYSTVLLEKLVHGSGRLPPNQHDIEITIPRELSYKVFLQPSLPGWDTMPATVEQGIWRNLVFRTAQRHPAGAECRGASRLQCADQSGASGVFEDPDRFAPARLLGQAGCLARNGEQERLSVGCNPRPRARRDKRGCLGTNSPGAEAVSFDVSDRSATQTIIRAARPSVRSASL